MPMSSWTIIAISLSCFSLLFMLTVFALLAIAWKLKKSSPVSPLKLSYSARKRSNNDNTTVGKSEFSRARSFTSLQACETSLAVQSERDSRRVIEKSSAFDYWWDDINNNSVQSKKCNGETNPKVDASLFSTYPPKHAGKTKQKRGQLEDGNLCVAKSYSVDDVLEKSLRTGDSLVKGDLRL